MKTNVIQEKSYAFALRIVNLYRWLSETRHEYVLSKQLLRSGTSIGANIEESLGGQSDRDFYAKMNIAYKETRETHYWLRLLKDSEYIDGKAYASIISDCEELLKLLGTITKTMKDKLYNCRGVYK